MAAHGARRLGAMVENLNHILGIELLCAVQGIEFRAPLKTSEPLSRVVVCLRKSVLTLGEDRYLAPDLEQASILIANAEIIHATLVAMPELVP
jgi:histidine ammonia-lyase